MALRCVFKDRLCPTMPPIHIYMPCEWGVRAQSYVSSSSRGKAAEVQDPLTAAVKCINLFNFTQRLPGSQLVQPGTAAWISAELLQMTWAGDLAQFLNLSEPAILRAPSCPLQIVIVGFTSCGVETIHTSHPSPSSLFFLCSLQDSSRINILVLRAEPCNETMNKTIWLHQNF